MQPSEWENSCHRIGTCALTGSAALFASIPGSYVIVNGPLWCYFYAMKYIDDSMPGAAERFYCTQPDQNSLVYGTEKDLINGFEYLKKNGNPERLFVQNNCSISLVGDDIEGIAAKSHLPWPVYGIDSGGLHGSFAGGFSRALSLLVQQMNPLKKSDGVNVLGLSSVYLRGKADAIEIRRLLELCDIHVVSMPGVGDSWESIMKAPEAALNIVVRNELALKAAEDMKSRFDIPYISVGLPYGMEGTLRWLNKIAEAVNSASLKAAEMEIRCRQKRLLHFGNNMKSMWGTLWFDRILFSAPPEESLGIAEALRGEWADTENLTVHLQAVTCSKTPAVDTVRVIGINDISIAEDYKKWDGGLILSSSHETERLLRMNRPFVSCHITRPVYDEMAVSDLPLCGIRGAEYLYEKIWNAKLSEHIRMAKT